MKKAEMFKLGEQYLAKNPNEGGCYVTSDGNVFPEKNINDVRNHAKRESLNYEHVLRDANDVFDVEVKEEQEHSFNDEDVFKDIFSKSVAGDKSALPVNEGGLSESPNVAADSKPESDEEKAATEAEGDTAGNKPAVEPTGEKAQAEVSPKAADKKANTKTGKK